MTTLGLAVGLAMDAFAVAVATGVVLGSVTRRQTFRLSFHFGLFQFLMPVVGWLAGREVVRWIGSVDHWVAFGLLAFVGGKMIHEAIWGVEEEVARDPTRGASLVILSVATSIDALAVGLTLGVLGVEIWYPAAVIGLVALLLTAAGLHLGRRLGGRLGRRMEVAGGVVLVLLGLRILFSHLSP
jgi:putative Mn2+ efflux pump MntP